MKVGTWVRLKERVRSGRQKARIEAEVPEVAEGAVLLSERLDGFRWWNKADLTRTTAPKAVPRG
jgi:hypothetical protein